MKYQKGFTLIQILIVFVVLFILAGWAQSVYKFTQCDFEAPYKCEAIYLGGILTPAGVIIGWINIEDGND